MHSVWRPLLNPVENYPLAVCDGSSVPEDKLLAVDHVRKHYVGEGLYPLADPQYRWYYLNQQTKDEVILIKTFDSKEGVAAKCKLIMFRNQRFLPMDVDEIFTCRLPSYFLRSIRCTS